MILSEHALKQHTLLKGNGDKLVIEFLSTLLVRHSSGFVSVMYEEEVEKRDADASARDSLIFSAAMQPVRFSFAYHVSCKVKYVGNVAKVKVRIRGKYNVLSCVSQYCRSMSPTSYQLWIAVVHEHNR